MTPKRLPGGGWIALVGGGEFTFEETLDADSAWMEKVAESGLDGPIGFVPAASGSTDYGEHFAEYVGELFGREAVTLPIFRPRDGRRGKNAERIAECAAVYLGGGVTDHLLDALAETPAAEALLGKLGAGGVVVAIAAAAQALGVAARSFRPGQTVPGLGWLPGGVVEPNFDPEHDRRLRRLLQAPGASWGVGLPAGSCLLLGPPTGDGVAVETVGDIWTLDHPEADLRPFESTISP